MPGAQRIRGARAPLRRSANARSSNHLASSHQLLLDRVGRDAGMGAEQHVHVPKGKVRTCAPCNSSSRSKVGAVGRTPTAARYSGTSKRSVRHDRPMSGCSSITHGPSARHAVGGYSCSLTQRGSRRQNARPHGNIPISRLCARYAYIPRFFACNRWWIEAQAEDVDHPGPHAGSPTLNER